MKPLTPIWAATVTDMGVDPDAAMRMRLSERDFPTMWRRA